MGSNDGPLTKNITKPMLSHFTSRPRLASHLFLCEFVVYCNYVKVAFHFISLKRTESLLPLKNQILKEVSCKFEDFMTKNPSPGPPASPPVGYT